MPVLALHFISFIHGNVFLLLAFIVLFFLPNRFAFQIYLVVFDVAAPVIQPEVLEVVLPTRHLNVVCGGVRALLLLDLVHQHVGVPGAVVAFAAFGLPCLGFHRLR